MKTIAFNDIVFEVTPLPEDLRLYGNLIDSGDAEYDEQVILEVSNRIDSGDLWAWCVVEVKATYRGVLVATDYLGGCSYQDETEFKEGGYYDEMKHNVVRLLQDQLDLVTA